MVCSSIGKVHGARTHAICMQGERMNASWPRRIPDDDNICTRCDHNAISTPWMGVSESPYLVEEMGPSQGLLVDFLCVEFVCM